MEDDLVEFINENSIFDAIECITDIDIHKKQEIKQKKYIEDFKKKTTLPGEIEEDSRNIKIENNKRKLKKENKKQKKKQKKDQDDQDFFFKKNLNSLPSLVKKQKTGLKRKNPIDPYLVKESTNEIKCTKSNLDEDLVLTLPMFTKIPPIRRLEESFNNIRQSENNTLISVKTKYFLIFKRLILIIK
jgi:hypothetical protein